MDYKYIERAKDYFNYWLPETLENLLDIIKSAYIEYYGESFKSKIDTVFKELKVIYIIENIDQSEINKKIFELSNDGTKLLELGLYCCANKNKKNKDNKQIVLFHSKNCNGYCEYDDYMEQNMNGTCATVTNADCPTIYIRINKDATLRIQGLIHEISHCMMTEPIYIDDMGQKVYQTGINEAGDSKLFNELINEFITKRVMDIVIGKIGNGYTYVSREFDSLYLLIDRLNGNLMKSIFLMLEPIIKESIIHGDPPRVKKILNDGPDKTYDYVCNIIQKMFNDVIGLSGIMDKDAIFAHEMRKTNVEEIQKRNNSILSKVNEKYIDYLRHQIIIRGYVDKLVKLGKAKKVS